MKQFVLHLLSLSTAINSRKIFLNPLRPATENWQPVTTNFFVMGKTKWYSETETTAGQHGYRTTNTNATARARKPSYSPGQYAADNPDAVPLPILFRQIWTRVRRSWVALRFRVNYLTFGFFKQRIIHHFRGTRNIEFYNWQLIGDIDRFKVSRKSIFDIMVIICYSYGKDGVGVVDLDKSSLNYHSEQTFVWVILT